MRKQSQRGHIILPKMTRASARQGWALILKPVVGCHILEPQMKHPNFFKLTSDMIPTAFHFPANHAKW